MTDTEKTDRAGLRSGLAALIAALEILSSIVIVIMMVLTFVDVIGRYVFAKPVFGASEIISALLAIAIFAGLGIANARDDHIVVELFDHRIRRMFPRFYDIAIQVFSVGVMVLIAYVLLEMAIEVHHQNTRTYVIEMPLFWIAGAVSALAAISVLSQVIGIYLKLTDSASPIGQEPEA